MEVVSVVVVPARDEQQTIARCLRALAEQTVTAAAFETIVVADACHDRTEQVARETARRFGLSMTVLHGPGAGSGPARRLGMDAAARRLRSLGLPRGLIATTDADSVPAPDWLERQLDHLADGAEVVAGLIELDADSAAALPAAVLARRRRTARRRLAAVAATEPNAGHHHFAGASLGVTADTYLRVGGLESQRSLEDEAFADSLRAHGVPIVRAADVRVRTAARTDGRAAHGLSVDLAIATWCERRRYRAEAFELEALRERRRDRSVTVVIAGPGHADTVAGVVETTAGPAVAAGLVDDVVVVADGSLDAERVARTGARVLLVDELAPELGPALGAGDAIWRALAHTAGELVCFLEAGTEDPDPRHLLGLIGPLLSDDGVALVKGSVREPVDDHAASAGADRLTELIARPLLNLHFPLLAGFERPLAGEFAARRELLERLAFPVGDGVLIAPLIDALRERGLDALAESDLGVRRTRRQPLRALGETAFAVLVAAERRVQSGRPVGGHYVRPWEDGTAVRVEVSERPPLRAPRQAATAVGCAVS